jgi:hypothetical protein
MSLFPQPILTNGATHSAQQFRLLVRDLARGAEGVTEGDDLKVTQRSTPGAGVTVSDGSGVIQGRVNAYQGHYAICNTGSVDVDIASTSDGVYRTLGGTGAPWTIPVPSWATKAIISVDAASIRLSTNPIFGQFRFLFGASLTGQSVNLDDNQTGVRRITGMTADTLTLPSAYRGTNQILTPQFTGQAGYGGKIGYDGATTILADVEFLESPR